MNVNKVNIDDVMDLLRKMVSIPSFSYQEDEISSYLYDYLKNKGVQICRIKNNIAAWHTHFDPLKPTLLLNSHIDTVKDSSEYTFNPFRSPIQEDRVWGLGSNDAGGALVSMISTFLDIRSAELSINVILLLTAEEECSGPNGMELVSNFLGDNPNHCNCEISYFIQKCEDAKDTTLAERSLSEILKTVKFAIIGEPTEMKAAVAERGLLVIDAIATGVGGHAAMGDGINAIYVAMEDISKIESYKFQKSSPVSGDVKMTVTQINAGSQHNVIPDICNFVIDIRTTECYSNKEITEILGGELKSKLTPRNLKNRSSATPEDSLLLKCVAALDIPTYISPTTSDWMRIGKVPAIKMGPGSSSRSHKANEYILKRELIDAVEGYRSVIYELSRQIRLENNV